MNFGERLFDAWDEREEARVKRVKAKNDKVPADRTSEQLAFRADLRRRIAAQLAERRAAKAEQ